MSWLINWLAGVFNAAVEGLLNLLLPYLAWVLSYAVKWSEFWANIIINGLLYLWLVILFLIDKFLIAFVALLNYVGGNDGILDVYAITSRVPLSSMLNSLNPNIAYLATNILQLNSLLACLNIYLAFLLVWTIYRVMARWIRG